MKSLLKMRFLAKERHRAEIYFKAESKLYQNLRKRLLIPLSLYLSAVLGAVVGLRLIEEWTYADCVYMAVLTLTTVGYSEVHPLSDDGRLFMIGTMLVNNALFFYAVASLSSMIVEGDLKYVFRGKQLMVKLNRMQNHVIVVGLGRVGRRAVEVIGKHGQDIVAIEKTPREVEIQEENGCIVLNGDGLDESLLLAAGLERADILCACLPQESENLVLTIIAKDLNPGIKVVARANTRMFRQRLRRAGAESVILPEVMAGTRFALESLGEGMAKFDRLMEFRATSHNLLEEVKLTSSSPLVGRTIVDANIRSDWSIIVFFINAVDGKYDANVPIDRPFREGDEVWLLGRKEDLSRFIEKMI